MSDGPHKSLPMRSAWKRLAERAAKQSYDAAEVCELVGPALARDWTDEIPATLLAGIRGVLNDGLQTTLFSDETGNRLEAMRSLETAPYPMARALLDNVIHAVAAGATGEEALTEAATITLMEAGQRRSLQIEEHYLRESTPRSSLRVRSRLDEGFGSADYAKLTREVLGPNGSRAVRAPAKKAGLDDGVSLP